MLGERTVAIAVLGAWAAVFAQPAPTHAAELDTDLALRGQVRRGDQSRKDEAPVELDAALAAGGLPRGARVETFFRLEHEFGLDENTGDFYAGYLDVPNAIPGVGFTVGRQFLNEGPVGVFVADAAKLRFDPGGPVAFTLYGGRPQYFEPTFSSEVLSQDEVIWGGSVRTTRLPHGRLSLGYFQQERDQRVLRQLITAAGARSLTDLPGMPSLYGSLAYDADHGNLDLATGGVQMFLSRPRLLLDLETSYYKPQDADDDRVVTDLNRREDAIFELFSVSRLLQFRGGLRYVVSRSLAAFGDYSHQRYEALPGATATGHVARTGIAWLPGGDGLERVQVEYYVTDSDGGNVNGGRAYYENHVYERLRFRTKVDAAYYEKENNQRDTAVSGLIGLGYVPAAGLLCEVYLEANHNKRFDEDFRFGFLISYRGLVRSEPPETPGRETS